jgi:hypothetical protein
MAVWYRAEREAVTALKRGGREATVAKALSTSGDPDSDDAGKASFGVAPSDPKSLAPRRFAPSSRCGPSKTFAIAEWRNHG